VYLSLFRTLKHKHLKRDEVVFNYGDEGETFYIILRG
jgi:CRP-like cAMP-binding protein